MSATEAGICAKLDTATLQQLSWKPTITRLIACTIVQHMLTCDDVLWPDEISFGDVPGYNEADANCVGLAYRNLTRQGILEHGASFRRSTAENARGRTIFCYRLASRSRAELFLKRNGGQVVPTQGELI